MEARRTLERLGSQVERLFIENRMLLSFEEWLETFRERPLAQARSSAQYLRDALDYFGTEQVRGLAGKVRRFRLFDREFDDGEGRVAGQEEAQNAIYRLLENFSRAGSVDKLILLHGPNGSAKSSIVSALIRGLEVYSRQAEGALYRINWVFPRDEWSKGSIGFGEGGRGEELESLAHLAPELTSARIACELKDHPLFLIPGAERQKWLQRERERGQGGDRLARPILEGELCHKCRQIYAGLLAAYGGDYLRVLRHVQVERFYISRRYLVGAVTVEPQLSVDASYRQLLADRSVGHLPGSLQNLDLFSPSGPLVAGNRGLIEYSDLLKRPPETYKYLLGTTETGLVPMEHFLLHLDQVMIATSNERHLRAFKAIPDFSSFKGRIELVRVPYLRSARQEREIYDQQLSSAAIGGKHIAPHATEIAATWAVLTRLLPPDESRFDPEVQDLISGLTPMEKLRLYDEGRAPGRMNGAAARGLQRLLPELVTETDGSEGYEGSLGASAREIRSLLLSAAQSPEHRCLSPLAVLAGLRLLCREKSVYEFLQVERRQGYLDPEAFIDRVEAAYIETVGEEVRNSLGLVTEAQVRELFVSYLHHVSHYIKGEKIANRITGSYEWPDEERMRGLERILKPEGEGRGSWRRALIATIGAWRLDHPEEEVAYERIFPDLFRKLAEHFYEERLRTLQRSKKILLEVLSGDGGRQEPKDAKMVEEALRNMKERYGYCEACAKEAIAFLLTRQ